MMCRLVLAFHDGGNCRTMNDFFRLNTAKFMFFHFHLFCHKCNIKEGKIIISYGIKWSHTPSVKVSTLLTYLCIYLNIYTCFSLYLTINANWSMNIDKFVAFWDHFHNKMRFTNCWMEWCMTRWPQILLCFINVNPAPQHKQIAKKQVPSMAPYSTSYFNQ